MRPTLLLALLVLGTGFGAQASTGDRVSRRIERASTLERAGDLAGARGELDAAIAEHPDHVGGWVARAALRLRARDRDGAEADIDRAVELAPRDREARIARAQLLADLRRLDEAVADLDAAHEASPRDLEVLRLRAEVNLDRGHYAAAERDLAVVRKRDRSDPAAATLHAYSLVLLDRRKEGFDAFTRLRPSLGDHPDYLRLRAAAHASLGEADDAISDLGRALRTEFPERSAARLERGFLLLAAGNYASSLPDLRAALDGERDPSRRARIRLWLGLALDRSGSRSDAIPVFGAGLEEASALPGRAGEVFEILFRCALGELPVAALLAEAPDPLGEPAEYCMNRFYAAHVLLAEDRIDEAAGLLREALLTGRRHLLEWQGARLSLEVFLKPVLPASAAGQPPVPVP